ncbi:MAG: hypothetical protein ACW97X_12300 [Candidatus Hodarchaeales archaeon]
MSIIGFSSLGAKIETGDYLLKKHGNTEIVWGANNTFEFPYEICFA